MSKPSPLIKGIVKDGQPVFDRPMMWKMALGALEGKRFECSVRRESKRKSAAERRYYWAVIIHMIADEIGEYGKEGEERVHEGLKRMFLTVHEDSVLPRIRSTEELTTVECEDYHTKCRMWASQALGIFVPEPNSVDF